MFRVTKHAVDQYIERIYGRTANSMSLDGRAQTELTIARRIARGREIQLPKDEVTRRLINNECAEARYLLDEGVLFVLVGQEVRTCYPYKLDQKRRKALRKKGRK